MVMIVVTLEGEAGLVQRDIRIYYLATLIAVLIWSISFIGTKIAYETFTPITLGALRSIIAAVILFLIKTRTKERKKPRGKDLIYITVSGLLGITFYFIAENIGVRLTSASNAALIVAYFPAITSLFEFFLYHKKPGIYKDVGIALAILGVYILFLSWR